MFSFMRSPANSTPEDEKLLYSQRQTASEDTDETNISFDAVARERQKRWSVWPFILHFGLVCVYTTILFLFLDARKDSCSKSDCDRLLYLPALDAMKYERATVNAPLGGKSLYVGEPGPEVDEAWNKLYAYTNTRLPKEEMDRINRTSILLNDEEGGYFVTLDVFHELHCLNMIRKQIYREYYPTKHSLGEQLEHTDHCIDILRQILMCHGDISIQTYEWIDDYRWPWPRFNTEHECRNWDAITDWAGQHYVESIVGPIFTHPTLGVSWREGDFD